jgi:preprotein translocase subunit SecE
VAKNMADKKKTTSRSQMADLKMVPEKKPAARSGDEVRTTGRGQVADLSPEKKPVVKSTTREERKEQPKKEQPRQESKPTRREAKATPSFWKRLRNGRVGRFISEAYYELRHKVTWPTFEQARNMTLVVIAVSVVIGAILGLVDYGLYNLFLFISGRQ